MIDFLQAVLIKFNFVSFGAEKEGDFIELRVEL